MSEFIILIGKVLHKETFSLLRIVIPLSLTVYIFVYRERKQTAYSTFKNKMESSIIIYWVLIVGILTLTFIGKTEYYSDKAFYSLLTTLFLSWFITLFYVFKKLINSINIFKVYEKQITLVNIYYYFILFLLTITLRTKLSFIGKSVRFIIKPVVKILMKRISICFQIKSQVLLTMLNHNMPQEFTNNLEEHLDQIRNSVLFILIGKYESFSMLNLTSEVEKTYDCLLGDVNLITVKSLDYYKDDEVEKIIYFYNNIVPVIQVSYNLFYNFLKKDNEMYITHFENVNRLTNTYYTNIYSLVKMLSLNNRSNNFKVLRMLVHQSEDSLMYVTSDEILAIFYSLIIDAIINNNVKSLTNTVNLADEFNKNNPIRSVTSSVDRGLTSISILAIVKSIELGHHGCAGFLIKNIMRKTEGISLKEEFSNVRHVVNRNNGKVDPVTLLEFNPDSKLEILESLNFQIHFSKASLEYCFSKSAFLLYGQQKYLNELGILGIRYPDLIEVRDYLQTYNQSYFINKVSGLHKEYGLSYLKNTDFVNNL